MLKMGDLYHSIIAAENLCKMLHVAIQCDDLLMFERLKTSQFCPNIEATCGFDV